MQDDTDNNATTIDAAELPFLVTHWLSNFQASASTSTNTNADALQRIHQAAADMASAFSELGAFGTANQPHLRRSRDTGFGNSTQTNHATYSDVQRQWRHVPPRQLELVVASAASVSAAALDASEPSSNLFQVARELRPEDAQGGRRLGDTHGSAGAIDLTRDEGSSTNNDNSVTKVRSILHALPFLDASSSNADPKKENSIVPYVGPQQQQAGSKPLPLSIVSDFETITKRMSDSMRAFLSTRESFRAAQDEVAVLQRAITNQENVKRTALEELKTAGADLVRAEIMFQESKNADRVMAQLGNKLKQVTGTRDTLQGKLVQTEQTARNSFQQCKKLAEHFRDPHHRQPTSVPSSIRMTGTMLDTARRNTNHVTSFLAARQCGVSRSSFRIGRPIGMTDAKQTRKALTASRLSHALTFNTHLTCPIYCLSFDKSGRYFCTGADDCLVKIFFLGAGPSKRLRRAFSYGANDRGAIHVCTLRGHAGVICDLDVSSDNAFLATASDDGDVRVWGMKDGCPIAILRGHGDGANMVSWSKLTPFRLVTSGMNGLAQIWDIREAALKRYGNHIGHRPEYTLALTESEKQTLSTESEDTSAPANDEPVVLLPPLPAREGVGGAPAAAAAAAARMPPIDPAMALFPPFPAQGEAAFPAAVPPVDPAVALLPPLPAGERVGVAAAAIVPPVNPAANVALPLPAAPVNAANPVAAAAAAAALNGGANNNNNVITGAFVANDTLDEGVRIVAKLQHGEVIQQDNGPGTRARRKKVNVICLARCPLGGHFVTGSDDGLCRVWEDADDGRVAMIDQRGEGVTESVGPSRSVPGNAVPSTRRLLTTLVGHMGAITDLHYSHTGDRILTASQKDGNARIWSFGQTPQYGSTQGNWRNRFLDAKQIVLRLSKITNSSAPRSRIARRGRGKNPAGSSASSVTCDVAVWTSDDSKIVTSQSCPVKASSQEIVPGSQLLLVWDSWTGNCLLAIRQAHQKQCPVIATHPLEPNIICSAGADGIAKVWDLEAGKCLFLHQNTITADPIAQNNQKGKESGYLDGTFDPSGQAIILTDDNGRISVFDCLQSSSEEQKEISPAWMKDQYLANDYYELFYNTNGYCVERGSEQPPHLAPRSARCNHAGQAWSDDVSDTYRLLKGPSPISEATGAFERNLLRSRKQTHLPGGEHERRAVIMTDFDPDRTVQISGSAEMVEESPTVHRRAPQASVVQAVGTETEQSVRRRTTTTGRALSSNYRWRDYDDLIREEGLNEADQDDEEDFVPAARQEEDEDLSDGLVSESDDDRSENNGGGRPVRARHNNQARSQRVNRRNRDREETTRRRRDQRTEAEVQPTRVSSRRVESRLATADESEEEEDSGFLEECLSTNNTPSGPFVHDYTVDGHLFKLTNSKTQVNREWLLRTESLSSYSGRKNYAPQVGDSVVYIPKAHAATIREFPTLHAPWKNWPSGTRWPVVRCRVVNIRYRFPYKDYFNKRGSETSCASVVAILTLEVTGIPEVSADREFPWPKPSFIDRQSRSAAQMFEVSIFESGCPECVFPEELFLWRLRTLEHGLRQRANNPEGLKVYAYYVPDGADQDPSSEEYEAEIIEYSGSEEVADEHLNKSGFESLLISWLDNSNTPPEEVSPWDVAIPEKAFEAPTTPSLTSEEKRAVSNLLRSIESTPSFLEFNRSVDTDRYSDYLARIEIPMDINRIKQRLRDDYYSSTLSVLFDVRLIRENCIKYNGPHADIGFSAFELYTAFKDGLKVELTKLGVSSGTISKLDEDPEIVINSNLPSTPRGSQGPRTRSLAVGNSRSSFELLPPPPDQVAARSTRTVAARGRASLEHPEIPVLGRLTSNEGLAAGVGHAGLRSSHSSRGFNQPNLSREPAGSGTARQSALPQGNRGHGIEEEAAGIGDAGNRSRSASRSRPQRATKRSRYADDDDEEEADEQSEDSSGVSLDRVAGERSTRASRRSSDSRSTSDVERDRGRRSTAQVASNNDSTRRHSSRARQPKTYEDVNSDIDLDDDQKQPSRQSASQRGSAGTAPPVNSRPSSTRLSRHVANDESEAQGGPRSARGTSRGRQNTEVTSDAGSPSRSSRRAKVPANYKVDSEDDSDEEADPPRKARSGKRARSASRKVASPEQESPGRKSRRVAAPAKYADMDSDFDEEDADVEEDVEEDDEEDDEEADSEEDFDSEEDEDEDVELSTQPARGPSRRGAAEPPNKRSRKSTSARSDSHSKVESWPSIPTGNISAVALGILEMMRVKDTLDLFAVPVTESFPEIEEEYRQKIKTPMDFRTIEEDRLPVYEEISELQNDLIQVFDNCAIYNGAKTRYGTYAMTLLKNLDEVFQDVCREEGVQLKSKRR